MLLLPLLGLLGVPVVHGEYRGMGFGTRTSETCLNPTLLFRAGVGDATTTRKPGGTHCLMLSWM